MKFIKSIKWILAILGTARGNIVGGFIGFIVGYIIEEYLNNNITIEFNDTFKVEKTKYTSYQNRLLALISEIVKADGYIHKEEIYFIKQFLLKEFGSVYTNMMMKTLKLQIDKRFDIVDISRKLKTSINYKEKIKLVTFLYGIAIQNKSLSKKERYIIETVAKIIGITQEDYKRIVNPKKEYKKRTQTKTKSNVYGYNPYKILGIKESASIIEIKKAYRKMVLKFHPDKTDIDDNIANEKFSEISKAYTIIKQKRGIK